MANEPMISPIETLIRFFSEQHFLNEYVGGRIATQQRFGEGWTLGPALTIKPDGGNSEIYAPMISGRYEIRCWGQTIDECDRLYRFFRDAVKNQERSVVQNSLLLSVYLTTEPAQYVDEITQLPYWLLFIEAMMAEGIIL